MKLTVCRSYTPHQTGGSLRPAGSFLTGEWTPLDKASQTGFSRSARLARKASEICLRASEKTVGESLTCLERGEGRKRG